MVKSGDKLPASAPGPRIQIKVANVVENLVAGLSAANSSANPQLVVVETRSMSGSSYRRRPFNVRLGPVRRFQIKQEYVGKMNAAVVLPAERDELAIFPVVCSVTWEARLGTVKQDA